MICQLFLIRYIRIPSKSVPKKVIAIEIPNSNGENVFSSEVISVWAVRTSGRDSSDLVSKVALHVEPDSVWTQTSSAENNQIGCEFLHIPIAYLCMD